MVNSDRGRGILGFELSLACPKGHLPDSKILKAEGECKYPPREDAAGGRKGADVLNTDVWASMGQERGGKEKMAFKGFTIMLRYLPLQ